MKSGTWNLEELFRCNWLLRNLCGNALGIALSFLGISYFNMKDSLNEKLQSEV